MRARYVQVENAGGPLRIVTREVPEPRAGEVRVRVDACGVCHSDSVTVSGLLPFIRYPRAPGHEIVGTVDSVGEDVPQWGSCQRVGIGWYGGHCRRCEPCRRGDLVACQNLLIPGVTYDGGYAEYVVVPAEALAAVPDSLKSVDAAPLLCAGITTFNALRNTGAKPPDTVAILGLGGLGHLGVTCEDGIQYDRDCARGREGKSFIRSWRPAIHR
jgi:D-arabinose 1-dehydrogenase-like Zn-dependent alcohol dehydrogenase